jgi:hypothetical protein
MSETPATQTSSATTTQTLTLEATTEVNFSNIKFRDLFEGFYHRLSKYF